MRLVKGNAVTSEQENRRIYSPARCNPHWGKAFVMVCQVRRWPELERMGQAPPRTFSAGPGNPTNRIQISLGESLLTLSQKPLLELSIRVGHEEMRTAITTEQAHSLEEGLRAVFLAAREEGLLPVPSRQSKKT